MQAPANQPEFQAVDPVVEDLNRIVEEAESLLKSLGEEAGVATEAARERVTHTLSQARARLAATADEAEQAAVSLVDRADEFVRANPWRAVVIAAALGGVTAYLLSRATRHS